jgi:hypothetical protein
MPMQRGELLEGRNSWTAKARRYEQRWGSKQGGQCGIASGCTLCPCDGRDGSMGACPPANISLRRRRSLATRTIGGSSRSHGGNVMRCGVFSARFASVLCRERQPYRTDIRWVRDEDMRCSLSELTAKSLTQALGLAGLPSTCRRMDLISRWPFWFPRELARWPKRSD